MFYQIYLSVGVSHVADYAAILHLVQKFPPYHIFIACRQMKIKLTPMNIFINKVYLLIFLKEYYFFQDSNYLCM